MTISSIFNECRRFHYFKRFKIISTDLAVLHLILWPRANDSAKPLLAFKKEVDGWKLMIDTKTLWLCISMVSPSAFSYRLKGVALLACYSESWWKRSLIKYFYCGEDFIDSTFQLFFILFYFFPRSWSHTERTKLLICRGALPSGWKITFWRLNKWVLFPNFITHSLRCLFYICKMEQLITCVTVVLWKWFTKCLQYALSFLFFWETNYYLLCEMIKLRISL